MQAQKIIEIFTIRIYHYIYYLHYIYFIYIYNSICFILLIVQKTIQMEKFNIKFILNFSSHSYSNNHCVIRC